MEKAVPSLCAPKSETPNFELLVPSKVQLQKKQNSILAKNDLLFTQFFIICIEKQYANMLEEYDTWSQVFDQTFEALLTSAARLSELPTRWSKRCQGKRLIKSVLTIRLSLNSEQPQTNLRGIKRTSIQRQYYLVSFSRATQVL